MEAVLSQKEFTAWVNEHADALYGYALRRVSGEEIAKDLVQETFLAAWRNRNTFRKEASARTWLFTILKSKLADHYRKASSRIQITDLQTENGDDFFFDEAGHWKKQAYPREWPAEFFHPGAVKEFQQVLGHCRKKLKEIQALVFSMKYLDEEESETICKELNISPANFWVIIHRAKVQLRACLEKNWFKL